MPNAVPKFSIVLPVYNEEESLPVLHAELETVMRALGESYELIYVDDHSTDRSLAVLLELKEQSPEMVVVQFPCNWPPVSKSVKVPLS